MAAEGKGGKTLDERIRLIEDRLEIYNLIASHPPSADTGAGDYTASVWTEDGVFDRGAEFPRPTGRAAIAGGSANPEHHRAIEQGIAHFAGLPYVRVTGDTAVAISYLQILVPDRVGPVFEVPNHGASGGFHVHRVSATAGSSCAPARAGRSAGGRFGRSTERRRRARYCAARWRGDDVD
jgi:hypothetical protein